jgi:hypothetical protein
MPEAREDGLFHEEIDDELLVYDHAGHRVHWLNHVATTVWSLCDGRTTIEAMVDALRLREPALANSDLVTLAICRLAGHHLLTERAILAAAPPRQELVRRVKRDGLGRHLPAVNSASLDTVIHAETLAPCHGAGEPCGAGNSPCCPGLTCKIGHRATGVCA